MIYFSQIAFEFPLAEKFLFVAAISQTQDATPEVVEITSEESGSEVGEKPSTEAIVEEPMTEEPGVEQESPDDGIPKEEGGKQGVSITPEGNDVQRKEYTSTVHRSLGYPFLDPILAFHIQ